MEKKKDIESAIIYYDHQGRQYFTRDQAVKSNKGYRDYTIETRVQSAIAKLLIEKVDMFKYAQPHTKNFSPEQIATYLIHTDLAKANRKIKELIKETTEQFDRENPDLVIK